ncbi:MAG: hypothetical protein SCARUB_05113 [Candidatus Scalindua rubra]|uniref:Uncharacterized protein n=1 Tax=Candidatus Scalindua rubra TaxID=1872076 RepID=A0A1E3X256_9BACT|nr:MAG: hypothetical protein SCARUB_05113 [Candidatus Scalindua rubra]
MKTTISLFVCLMTMVNLLLSQIEPPFECGTDDSDLRDLTVDDIRGGTYIPSIGELKVLVVFTRLIDDNDDWSNWPLDATTVAELSPD